MSDQQRTNLTDALGHLERAVKLIRTEVDVTQPDGQEIASLREQVDALSRRMTAMRAVVVAGRRVTEVFNEGGKADDEIRTLSRAIADAEAGR